LSKLVCANCSAVFDEPKDNNCPNCGLGGHNVYEFSNSDDYLRGKIPEVMEERRSSGLDGLVGDLNCVIINVEPENHDSASNELLGSTGHMCVDAFEDGDFKSCVLRMDGSADIVVRARLGGANPFLTHNSHPKSEHLPNTRLETFVFETRDIEKYFSIQESLGVRFLTDGIIHKDNYSFVQTVPSMLTSNSIGVIEWTGAKGNYFSSDAQPINLDLRKSDRDYLRNIGALDHTATRIKARDRDAAVIEFMRLTTYDFDFAIYVKLFNSITGVVRLSGAEYAAVFTSGISPLETLETSGPTEKFTYNYGPRVHHMAFLTEHIDDTLASLQRDGMDFLIDLVGSRDEGLKQAFSAPSKETLLVNEYIHRFGDFDGFFTKSNVTMLTGATSLQ
jgi:4-hydroxyphenylpyruvate dioxygenase-like putative hemolysin